jgi:tetratricopeptide (TPR) repeat protein
LVLALVCLTGAAAFGWFVIRPYLQERSAWQEAERALTDDDLPLARTRYEDLFRTSASKGAAHFHLGRVCRRAGDSEAAKQHLQLARQLKWNDEAVTLEEQLLQAQLGFARSVESQVQQHLAQTGADARWICEAMVRGYVLGNFLDEAYRWTTLWLELMPDDWLAHDWSGRVLEAGQRQDLAAAAYEKALARKPGRQETEFRLAEVLAGKGHWAEALSHYQACLERDSGDVAARIGLARCQRMALGPEAARATLEELLSSGVASAGAFLLRGQLELDSGRPDQALGWLRRAEQLARYDPETCQALASTLRLLNQPVEAETYEVRRRQLHQDLKRMAELTKEMTQHTNDVSLRYEAGVTLVRLGREQEAVRMLVSAFLLDRQHEPTRKALSECLKNLGDAELAARYRRLLETSKESP